MNQNTQKSLIVATLGAVGLYLWSKNSAPNGAMSGPLDGSSGESNFLSNLMSGLTDTVGEMTGTLQENFVGLMSPIAESIQAQYGIHPLITITQAAHESGWGASGLTKKANNLYGYTFSDSQLNSWLVSKGLPSNTDMATIRGMDLSSAPFIILQTHEEVANTPIPYFSRPNDLVSQDGTDALVYRPFRRYDSWMSSVQDWVTLLHGTRYAKAFADALAGDMDAFAQDIYSAGYATDSTYPTQLARVAGEVSDIQNA